MYFRQLRYFAEVADLGSFTAAARTLHVSQPALGIQIKKLEDELGVVLLKRHSRGVSTTPAGDVLLSHAREILQRLDTARQSLQRFRDGRGGTFRVGVTPSVGRALATAMLERCADRLHDVELQIIQGFSDPLATNMLEGKLDFAFSHRDLTGETWAGIPLFVEEPHIFGRAELLRGLPDPILFSDLARLPLVVDSRSAHTRQRLSGIARDWRISLSDVVEIDAINILREMVAKGNRCALSPFALFADELREGRLDVRRLDEPRLARTLYLNCRRVENMSAAERNVREIIRALVDEHIASGRLRWLALGLGAAAAI